LASLGKRGNPWSLTSPDDLSQGRLTPRPAAQVNPEDGDWSRLGRRKKPLTGKQGKRHALRGPQNPASDRHAFRTIRGRGNIPNTSEVRNGTCPGWPSELQRGERVTTVYPRFGAETFKEGYRAGDETGHGRLADSGRKQKGGLLGETHPFPKAGLRNRTESRKARGCRKTAVGAWKKSGMGQGVYIPEWIPYRPTLEQERGKEACKTSHKIPGRK